MQFVVIAGSGRWCGQTEENTDSEPLNSLICFTRTAAWNHRRRPHSCTDRAGSSALPAETRALVSSSLTNTSGSLTVSNTGNNFFTGVGLVLNGGAITFAQPNNRSLSANLNGGGSFNKDATSRLTLTGNSDNFSGPFNINAGTLQAGRSNVLGTGVATVASGATLDIGGNLLTSSSTITVAGTGADGFGAINNSVTGPGKTNALANVTLSADASFGASGNAWGISGTLAGGGFRLTKTNTHDVWIQTGSDTDLGDIVVNQGRLVFGQNGTTLGQPAKEVVVRTGATLAFATTNAMPQSGSPPDPFFAGAKPLVLLSGAVLESIGFPVNLTSVNSHDGTISLVTNGHFRVGQNSRLVLNGPISGNGQLILTNNGTLHLNGTNTYASNTLVYSGTLVLSNVGSQPYTNGAAIKLFDAASYVSGPVAIQPASPSDGLMWDATTLAIDGTLRVTAVAPLTVAAAARLGDGNVSFTLSGTVGQGYTIRASTDASTPVAGWTVLQSGTLTSSPLVFTDLTATNYPQRFYSTSTP